MMPSFGTSFVVVDIGSKISSVVVDFVVDSDTNFIAIEKWIKND